MHDLDPSHCPVCGVPNDCAMATAAAPGCAVRDCWCTTVEIAPERLALVPDAARARACICRRCAGADEVTQ